MRALVLAVVLLFTLQTTARAESAADLTAIGGGMYPGGAYVEQRVCQIKRLPAIGCLHMVYGTQHGKPVFDLFATSGAQLRIGRIDVTPLAGVSVMTGVIVLGALVAWPFGLTEPTEDMLKIFPVTANAGVSVGYTLVEAGRFRLRGEAGVRGYLPLFTDSALKLPTPHGLAATIGIGAGY